MNYLCVADENISLEAYVQVLGFWFVKVDKGVSNLNIFGRVDRIGV